MPWTPWLGPAPDARGTHFRVWAPRAKSLQVKVDGRAAALRADADGYYTAHVEGVRPGARYVYRFADGRERPDPASLLQPDGVHGPSEVVDLAAFAPRSPQPQLTLQQLVFCEIHLGTYSPEGTADGAARHLPELADAGYTVVEVMPVAAFPGARNWGYDGVALFACNAAYGGPAALARLVDAAHANGLRAFLDVVYNHLGPEGNYLAEFGPYFTERHHTPWGAALNFDGPDAKPVRRFFVENALRWTARAGGGFDGLRLDAVHGILDDSPKHILQELAEAVHAEARETGRTVHVIAESDLNDPKLIDEFGLDGVWADDLHHTIHVALTGEHQGYYADFQEPLPKMVDALRAGWHYDGKFKPSFDKPHGRPAGHLRARHFVICAQNHDQIGNRANGERLRALTDTGGVRAAAALVALQPALPLYFQGEEWDAPEPFLYFTSHGDKDLAAAVSKGRREEFKAFAWGGDVPDPQDERTFLRSKLDRAHRSSIEGQAALRWNRALLQLRRNHPALRDDARAAVDARTEGTTLLLRRGSLLLVAAFAPGDVEVAVPAGARVVLDSASPRFAPEPGTSEAALEGTRLRFRGRGAVVLEVR